MTDWSSEFIAVDWGTTNRRAYLVDGGGAVRDEFEDDVGVMSVSSGDFQSAVDTITQRLGDRPMLLAGMIGSNRGWREAPYLRCPASPEELAGKLLWIEAGRIAIVPGLSLVEGARGDVMRGEEVQVFGLLRMEGGRGDWVICHPGTHTKWVLVSGGAVADFTTVMTGELFSLLRDHSILAPLLQGESEVNDAFFAGVDASRSCDVLGAELFAIRARVLLGLMEERDAAPYASGLLLGCDLRAGKRFERDGEVVVVGRPSLTKLYVSALLRCNMPARAVDGAAAFVAGMHHLRKLIA